MPDYKLTALFPRPEYLMVSGDALKTEALRPTANAFVTNMKRVDGLIYMPAMLCFMVRSHQRAFDVALYDETGDIERVDEASPRFAQIQQSAGGAWLARLNAVEEDKSKWTETMTTEMTQVQTLVGGAKNESPILAWLASALVTTWTAFETLAGDLWTAAINAHPSGLAELNGNPNRIKKPPTKTGGDGDRSESATKSVDLTRINRLTNGSYDIRNCMGDLLRGRFKFTTLSGIREAYSTAFSDKEKKSRPAAIDAALSDSVLDALSAVRNLIVHKAGCVDDDYREAVKAAPTAPKAENGQTLLLDGERVSTLINPVVECCVKLLLAVDNWLILTGTDRGQDNPNADP